MKQSVRLQSRKSRLQQPTQAIPLEMSLLTNHLSGHRLLCAGQPAIMTFCWTASSYSMTGTVKLS